jgi:hypothetical protein
VAVGARQPPPGPVQPRGRVSGRAGEHRAVVGFAARHPLLARLSATAVGAAWFLRGAGTDGVVEKSDGAAVAPDADAVDDDGGADPDDSVEALDD